MSTPTRSERVGADALGIGETEGMMRTHNTHEKGALFGFDGVNTWVESTLEPVAIRRAARKIIPGDLVRLPASRLSVGQGSRPQVLEVSRSERSGWAPGTRDNPWWRLSFVDGYWVESAASHTFEVGK